jgi:hypothetical protein
MVSKDEAKYSKMFKIAAGLAITNVLVILVCLLMSPSEGFSVEKQTVLYFIYNTARGVIFFTVPFFVYSNNKFKKVRKNK